MIITREIFEFFWSHGKDVIVQVRPDICAGTKLWTLAPAFGRQILIVRDLSVAQRIIAEANWLEGHGMGHQFVARG